MAEGKVTKDKVSDKDPFINIKESSKAAEAQVKVLELTLKSVVELAKTVKAGIPSAAPSDNASIKERNQLIKEAQALTKAKVLAEKSLKQAVIDSLKVEKEKQRLVSLNLKNERDVNKAVKATALSLKQLEAQRQREVKASIKRRQSILNEANDYKTLTKNVNSAQAKFKRLAAQHGVNSKQAIKANIAFAQLDDRLRKINKTARDGRRDVGRYGLAFKEVGVSLKSLLFAGGVVGVIRGIGAAFKDAFDRVREFDKEMNNLAGIAGTTRDRLKSTEKEIIRVAGSSIKTSNEVAKLATSITALGKTQSEVRRLLKPINDLSIALGATSDEAGELLVGTLNAFGKGAESGQHFADVIAKIRTSTSLDFERIKDSFGFVTSSASALDLTIGNVGAQLGVLQDNNFKAARAGRLLNSSFLKLAKDGKTLEDALDEINKAQDEGINGLGVLSIAGDLFGKQSASLGLILANNRDRVAELTNEFDNLSEGSLKKLTDEQLKSMDAQLKILDSTWEKLILSIENGEGILSDIFKGVISGAIEAIDAVEKISTSIGGLFKQTIGAKQKLLETTDDLLGLDGVGAAFTRRGEAIEKTTDRIADSFVKKDLKTQKLITSNLLKRIKDDLKLLKDANIAESLLIEERIGANQLLLSKLVIVNKEVEKGTKVLVKNTGATKKNARAKRELTGLLEKQAKVVSDLNGEIERATTEDRILELSLELDVESDELERLRRIVGSSLEEIQKIELDLIEDTTEKRIALEKEKSDKLIEQIRTNSRAEESVKNELIVAETERFENFELDQAIEKRKRIIKQEADFSRAEIEQRRTGFKTQEEFEEFKSEEFTAIKRNQLEAELKLLEFADREQDELRREQLKAQIEGLSKFEEATQLNLEAVRQAIQLVEDVIVKSIDARIDKLSQEEQAHKDSVSEFKQAARDGNIVAKESLAEEQILADEAERKQAELEQKKQNILLVTAVLKAFTVELENPENSGSSLKAFGKAVLSIGAVEAFAGALPAFLEGTEDTGNHGSGLDGNGGFTAMLHSGEGVIVKEDNQRKLNAGLTNKTAIDKAISYDALMEQKRLGNLMGDTQIMAIGSGIDFAKMESGLNRIEQAIIDKPEPSIEIGAILQKSFEIKESVKRGRTTTSNIFIVKT